MIEIVFVLSWNLLFSYAGLVPFGHTAFFGVGVGVGAYASAVALREGEAFAIIGPNGAGKTTLFKVLTGERMPSAGVVRYRGKDVTATPAHLRARMGFGRTFQVSCIFSELDLKSNVAVAIESRLRYSGGTPGPWWRWSLSDSVRAETAEILDRFGFARSRWDDEAQSLSHGDRKRLEFCVALATRPEILMLDEPTAGMSQSDRKQMTQLLARMRKEAGVTIVMTEHDMDIIFELADRLMVLNYGKVIANGDPVAVRDDPTVREVYLGQRRQHA